MEAYFGKPRGYSSEDTWSEIESGAGALPQEYKAFAAAYGPGLVGGLVNVFHPDQREFSMLAFTGAMAPIYQEIAPGSIPYGVYPAVVPGMIQWASTADCDVESTRLFPRFSVFGG